MAISNAERQAQHRERLKAKLSIMEDLVIRTRRDIREWKRSVAMFQAGLMRLTANGQDRSEDRVIRLKQMIAENQRLVDQFDPDGLLADGEVEMGDLPPAMASQLWKGRHVSYALDTEGRAFEIRAYDALSAARTDALMTPGRHFGTIGAQGWSISAPID